MKFIKTITTLLFLGSLTTVVSCDKSCRERNNKNCICNKVYAPVCGCNNKTYGNDCEAKCAGIKEYTQGECPE